MMKKIEAYIRPEKLDDIKGLLDQLNLNGLSVCQVIIQKAWPWTIVGDVFGVCHAPCTLKTPFVVFEKE